MTHRRHRVLLGCLVFLAGAMAGCGGDGARPFGGGTGGDSIGNDAGTGGTQGSGGQPGTGGIVVGTGGTNNTGGMVGTGGGVSSGGAIGSGGLGAGGRGGGAGMGGRGGATGSGGTAATGGRPGTGGGVVGTGGAGGRLGTGGSGGQPGTGGSGGRTGTGGTGAGVGTGGNVGTGGATQQATCDTIASSYLAEIPKAKVCTDQAGQVPCAHFVPSSLGCNSGCMTFVHTPTRLKELTIQWSNAGCDQLIRICPAVICVLVDGAKCVSSGPAAASCVDVSGGVTGS